MADMLAVLYSHVLRIDPTAPEQPNRDRLIISKGHSAAAVYAVLANCGFFPHQWLDHYCENGGLLAGHVSHQVPGVELSTGSLGHGLSVATGLALAAKIDRTTRRSFVILSDGECDEGAIWEAALFAGHNALSTLTVLIDYNKIQSFGRVCDVLTLEPFADKWRAFGWAVQEVDGHDHDRLRQTLGALPLDPNKPSLVLCHTVKGKGVSFMEDQIAWHYKSPNDEQLALALAEVEGHR
jgi:transketolase